MQQPEAWAALPGLPGIGAGRHRTLTERSRDALANVLVSFGLNTTCHAWRPHFSTMELSSSENQSTTGTLDFQQQRQQETLHIRARLRLDMRAHGCYRVNAMYGGAEPGFACMT